MTVRDSFVAAFSEEEARRFEDAAESHDNESNSANRGSDPFKWVILIIIGYQCAEIEHYRAHHEIEAPWPEVQAWIKAHADLASHDGDCDYLGAFLGRYDQYVRGMIQ